MAQTPASSHAPAPPDPPAWTRRPVWATGLARSGTTLLLSLLDGHSRALAYPVEPSFRLPATRPYHDVEHLIADWLLGTPNPMHLHAVADRVPGVPGDFDFKKGRPIPPGIDLEALDLDAMSSAVCPRGIDAEQLRAAIDMPRYHRGLIDRLRRRGSLAPADVLGQTMLALADALRHPVAPDLWLFKHPMANYRPEDFDWFFQAFAEGRAIMILRDPRAQFGSAVRYDAKPHAGKDSGWRRFKRFHKLLRRVEANHLAMLAAARRYGPGRVELVRYEDLVQDTPGTMRRLAAFLGVDFEDILTRPTLLGQAAAVETASGEGRMVNAQSLERWRDDFSPAQHARIEAALDRFFRLHPRLYQPTRRGWRTALLRHAVLPVCYGLSRL